MKVVWEFWVTASTRTALRAHLRSFLREQKSNLGSVARRVRILCVCCRLAFPSAWVKRLGFRIWTTFKYHTQICEGYFLCFVHFVFIVVTRKHLPPWQHNRATVSLDIRRVKFQKLEISVLLIKSLRRFLFAPLVSAERSIQLSGSLKCWNFNTCLALWCCSRVLIKDIWAYKVH